MYDAPLTTVAMAPTGREPGREPNHNGAEAGLTAASGSGVGTTAGPSAHGYGLRQKPARTGFDSGNAVAGPSSGPSYAPDRSQSHPATRSTSNPSPSGADSLPQAQPHQRPHAAPPAHMRVNPLDPSTYFPSSYATGISRIPPPINTDPFTSQHPDQSEGAVVLVPTAGTGPVGLAHAGVGSVSAHGSAETSPLPREPQARMGYSQPVPQGHAIPPRQGPSPTPGTGGGQGHEAGQAEPEGYGGFLAPTMNAQNVSQAPSPNEAGPNSALPSASLAPGQPFPSVLYDPSSTYPPAPTQAHPHTHAGPSHSPHPHPHPPHHYMSALQPDPHDPHGHFITHSSTAPYPYNPHYVPGEIPHDSLMAPPQFLQGPPPHMMQMTGPHSVQVHGYPLEEWADWDEEGEVGEWPADLSGQHVEVRHRRKTSPEQLKVLEHWFNVNPKPDNHLREWLAKELGMTKRNIQVWFQNRRAKIKSNAFKNRIVAKKDGTVAELAPDALKTPERQTSSNPLDASPSARDKTSTSSPGDLDLDTDDAISLRPAPAIASASSSTLAVPPYPSLTSSPLSQGALPLSGPAMNGGRRVSLANGEAERIQVWAAKRTAQSGLANGQRSPMGVGALMGTTQLGQAAAARRGSIPYPYPAGNGYLTQVSPRISPSVRHTPSALHLAAIRNNTTRRSSMPGAPQLISSGAFTPPRVVDGTVQRAQRERELDPIRDDHESVFGDPTNFRAGAGVVPGFTFGASGSDGMGLPTTYLTPPQTSFQPSDSASSVSANGSLLFTGGSTDTADDYTGMLYTPAGPLPNPGFSFGTALAPPSSGSAGLSQPHSAPPDSTGFAFGRSDNQTREMELFFQFRDKGRLDSMASASGYGSDGTTGTANGSMVGQAEPWDWGLPGVQGQAQGLMVSGQMGQGQMMGQGHDGLPLGFNADRRASAPDGLQHDLGMLGLDLHSNNQLGPSPLGQHQHQGSHAMHVRTYSGDVAQYVPSIALHSSDEQQHHRPMPLHIQTDLLIPAGAQSGPSSAVGLGATDPFTLSPADMQASPLGGPVMSAHSTSHSHSGGPSPDSAAMLGNQGPGTMQHQGMAKASHSVPVPMSNRFQINPQSHSQSQPQPQQYLNMPQHFGQSGHGQGMQGGSGSGSGGMEVNADEAVDDMAWLDLGIDPALQGQQDHTGFMGSYGST